MEVSLTLVKVGGSFVPTIRKGQQPNCITSSVKRSKNRRETSRQIVHVAVKLANIEARLCVYPKESNCSLQQRVQNRKSACHRRVAGIRLRVHDGTGKLSRQCENCQKRKEREITVQPQYVLQLAGRYCSYGCQKEHVECSQEPIQGNLLAR